MTKEDDEAEGKEEGAGATKWGQKKSRGIKHWKVGVGTKKAWNKALGAYAYIFSSQSGGMSVGQDGPQAAGELAEPRETKHVTLDHFAVVRIADGGADVVQHGPLGHAVETDERNLRFGGDRYPTIRGRYLCRFDVRYGSCYSHWRDRVLGPSWRFRVDRPLRWRPVIGDTR